MIDLAPHHLETVQRILSEYVPDAEVRAFGSRATWTAKDYSDLDLAVVGDGPLDRRTLSLLKEAFEESTLPIRVEILDWHAITDGFRETIKHESVILKDEGVKRTNTSGWRRTLWGELATLEYGKSLRNYDRPRGSYRVYGTNGPIGWHDEPLCPYASVIIGRKGAYRGVHYSPDPFFVIDTAFYLEPVVEMDTRWAYYQLLTHDINQLDSGSAIPSTSREDFYSLSVAVPPLEEQDAIAKSLGALDDKIEENRRTSETLAGVAGALFQSWFVDFDPVRAKVEGRSSGLPPSLDDLFPDSFEPSELGEIPAGWNVAGLEKITEQLRENENPLKSPDTLFHHYSIPAYDADQTPKREFGESIKSLKTQVQPNTILLSKLNPEIERVWLVDAGPDDRAVCSTEFLVLRPKHPFTLSYLYCLARSSPFRRQIESLVTGTSRSHQRVQAKAVLSLPVVIPTTLIVQAFSRLLTFMLDRILHSRREISTLAAMRDALLPKLLSGELRVTNISAIRDGLPIKLESRDSRVGETPETR